MGSLSRVSLGCILLLSIAIICAVLLHLGGGLWKFSPLVGALSGGLLTLFAALRRLREDEEVEPWLGNERLAWILVGLGLMMWASGECIWRYYSSIHQAPFPSLADAGYAGLSPLVFMGLLLLPSSGVGSKRLLILLDSLITMGSMLSIGWYVLLGSLALSSNQDWLARFLGLYYPTTDIALLSCVLLLLFRGQGTLYQATARRVSLIVIGVGLCFFASSDFIFNVQQNAGTYVDGTWRDLGWPLGLLAIGVAAHLRRYLPLTSDDMIERRLKRHAERSSIGLAQLMTYGMLGVLCCVLILNVFSSDPLQRATRSVLVLATMIVIGLVVVRQILTIRENERLTRRQANALERLEIANHQIEEQARMIAEKNNELEEGISHLKDVQARLANGNLRTRARLNSGPLMPLAASLNLMAERLAYLEQANDYAQRVSKALQELIGAVERSRAGSAFRIPASCKAFPEIGRLMHVLGLREKIEPSSSTPGVVPHSTPVQVLNRSAIPPSFSGVKHPSQPLQSLNSRGNGGSTPVPKTTGHLHNDHTSTPLPGPFAFPRQDGTDEAGKS